MLDLDPGREASPPRDAATLVMLRDGGRGLEVFAVERNKRSRFLGGALVFPGGKVDPDDASPEWDALSGPLHPRATLLGERPRAYAIAACREALEEAALLPLAAGELGHDALVELRARVAEAPLSLRTALAERGLRLDLERLVPFARWVTPAAEQRRFDARFYLARCPDGQRGVHDDQETKASFWARPAEILARFEGGELELYPPTHRTLELLSNFGETDEALRWAEREACLLHVCPQLVAHVDARGETLALALPGDPAHEVPARRVPGHTRYVLRGARWLPEAAP